MADNLTLPATGAIVSTEEVTTLNGAGVAAQHVQRFILALRTADGTAVDLPGDAANGLDVDVTRMPALVIAAGAAHIGEVSLDAAGLAALETTTANQGAAAGI